MTSTTTIITVIICVLLTVLFIVTVYSCWKCHRRRYLLKIRKLSRKKWNDEHCNSLRGNLIRTYHTPIEDHYIIDKNIVLGRGGFGVVVLGRHKETGNEYALKFMNKKNEGTNRIEREVKLLKDVDHTNIVGLFSVYDTLEQVGFVLELCTGGHLGTLVERKSGRQVSEEQAQNLIRQLLSAVTHMHDRGICHRDIKLQNILLENGSPNAQIKLIDFGFGTRFIGATPLRTRCGTPYTTAPEVFRENYDERCDVWSAGVVAYIVICGRRPFEILHIPGELENAGRAAMITNILLCRYHFNHPQWKRVSPLAIDFVQNMMHHDYRSRWNAKDALEHEWIDPSSSFYMETQKTRASTVEDIGRILSNMRRASFMSSLHKTSMLAVVFSQPSNGTDGLRTLFQNFDSDHNGTLSKEEFVDAMQYMSQETLSPQDADTLFQAIDINNDKQISFTEFLAATMDPREVDVNELNKAFELLDIDKKGHITVADLLRVLDAKRHRTRSTRPLNSLSNEEQQDKEGALQRGTSRVLSKMSSIGFFKSGRSTGIRDGSQSNASIESDFSQSQDMHANLKERKFRKGAELEELGNEGGFVRIGENDVSSVEDIVDPILAARIQDILNQCDMNGDGVISYSEFLWAMADGDGLFHAGGILSNPSVVGDDSGDSDCGEVPNPAIRRGTSMPIIRCSDKCGPQSPSCDNMKCAKVSPACLIADEGGVNVQLRRKTEYSIGERIKPTIFSNKVYTAHTSLTKAFALPIGSKKQPLDMKEENDFDISSTVSSMQNNISIDSPRSRSDSGYTGLPTAVPLQSILSNVSDDDLSTEVKINRVENFDIYNYDESINRSSKTSSAYRGLTSQGSLKRFDSDLSCHAISDKV